MDRRMGVLIARVIVILCGILLVALGLVLFATEPSLPISGLITAAIGVALIVGALIERMRYRSASAEFGAAAPGPGGGEPTDQPMDPRFRRTDERFIDPTTSTSMRVWLDPATGERRYRAED
jgi:hypothetical protein